MAPARADVALPTPLRADDVAVLARSRRAEILAARARARAAAQRPTIVSALDEPSISGSIDHLPFNFMGLDGSITVEQSFPLSRVRSHRKRAAEANARSERATADGVALDVELEAAAAFYMLAQVRESVAIVERQHAIAQQLEAAAMARYSTSTGPQSDVLRAQTEVARLAGE